MKRQHPIKRAIDESLSSVHFDAHDMQRVLRAVREQEAPRSRKARRVRLDLLATAAAAVLVIVPLSLVVLRAQTADIAIIAATGAQTAAKTQAPGGEDPVLHAAPSAAPTAVLSEHDAIAVARACFEAQCDTTIFTFDEYTVSCEAMTDESGAPAAYVVTMESVYDNGCAFRVVVSAPDGAILSHSSPEAATVPAQIDETSEEVLDWYARYGQHRFMWPLEAQAEFSRRYEGGRLRAPQEGDMDEAAIRQMAMTYAEQQLGEPVICGISLFSERFTWDGQARYLVCCFPGDTLPDPLPETCLAYTFLASDGTAEMQDSIETDGL